MSRSTKRVSKRAPILTAAAAFSLLVVALIGEIRQLDAVATPESKLDPGDQTALLVLDVQEEYTGASARAPFPYPGSAELVQRVNQIAKRSAESGVHVLYVRQVYSRPLSRLVSWLLLGGRGGPGSAGAAFDHRLRLVSTDAAEKPGADAFSSPLVRQFMATHHIGEVWIVGLDGAGCVDRTARGARARGLRVSILDDAVASLDAAKLVALRADYAREQIAIVPASARLGSD